MIFTPCCVITLSLSGGEKTTNHVTKQRAFKMFKKKTAIWSRPSRKRLSFWEVCLTKVWIHVGNFPLNWKFRVSPSVSLSDRCIDYAGVSRNSSAIVFQAQAFYDVTANISFVLRWRISLRLCPAGVKQTANMTRLNGCEGVGVGDVAGICGIKV